MAAVAHGGGRSCRHPDHAGRRGHRRLCQRRSALEAVTITAIGPRWWCAGLKGAVSLRPTLNNTGPKHGPKTLSGTLFGNTGPKTPARTSPGKQHREKAERGKYERRPAGPPVFHGPSGVLRSCRCRSRIWSMGRALTSPRFRSRGQPFSISPRVRPISSSSRSVRRPQRVLVTRIVPGGHGRPDFRSQYRKSPSRHGRGSCQSPTF